MHICADYLCVYICTDNVLYLGQNVVAQVCERAEDQGLEGAECSLPCFVQSQIFFPIHLFIHL